MVTMLYHLAYISVAALDFDRAQLTELAEKAATHNKAYDISGALVFDGTHFFQYLEGNEFDIRLLYKKIQADPRHKDVTILSESPIEKRVYPTWGMKSFLPSDFNLEDRVHILDLLCKKLPEETVPEILESLETPAI